MDRRKLLGTLGLTAAGIVMAQNQVASAQEKRGADPHTGHFEQCAKACAECMLECESCARHCAELIAKGQKEHMLTLSSCADCAEFCASAAKIVARQGILSVTMCEACAQACDRCGEACEKFPQDERMKRCAQECRECARACREMIKHAQAIKKG